MEFLRENIERVRDRIGAAARRRGRNPEDITLVAVTKGVPAEIIEKGIELGLEHLGENRAQEFLKKYPLLQGKGVHWHFIGHLQRNKVRYIWDKVDLIHSVDSLRLAQELNRRALEGGRKIKILVQVNVAREEGKFGVAPEDLLPLVRQIASLEGLCIEGLMTLAPWLPDPEEVRPVFRRLYELSREVEALSLPGVQMRYLSMGMSNDFEVAIEEGANLVRIGRAIFGKNT
mgnify:CR=1 FL=1